MEILITGSVAYDYLMTFPGRFKDHILPDKLDTISLSFLVSTMVRHRGGTAPNIAYTLALLGERPRIFVTVGEDFAEYRAWLESAGVDTTLAVVVPEVSCASFFANTDLDNNQIASFYPGAMGFAATLSFHRLDGFRPDLAVISPNDPAAMTQYARECRELGIPYLYDPSQQIVRLSGADLREGVEGAYALFVNEYEFELLQKHTGLTPEKIRACVELLVVTLGEKGAQISAGGETYHIPVVPPEQIADPTGVGDAFRGGFLAGYSRGWNWELCGQMGALAATYVLEHHGPQSHTYTRPEFVARFRQHFDDHGLLDALKTKDEG